MPMPFRAFKQRKTTTYTLIVNGLWYSVSAFVPSGRINGIEPVTAQSSCRAKLTKSGMHTYAVPFANNGSTRCSNVQLCRLYELMIGREPAFWWLFCALCRAASGTILQVFLRE